MHRLRSLVPRQLLHRLRRRWLSLVAVVVLAVAVSPVVTFVVVDPTYEASAQLLVTTDTSDSVYPYSARYFAQDTAASLVDLGLDAGLYQHLEDTLDLTRGRAAITEAISAEQVEGTSLVEVTVRADDPARARALAGATVTYLTGFVNDFDTGGETSERIALRPVGNGSYETTRTGHRPLVNLGAAGVIGLLMGVALVNLTEGLDHTLRDAGGVSRAAGSPVLAAIHHDERIGEALRSTDPEDLSVLTGTFHVLRAQLERRAPGGLQGCLMVTSAGPGEGKTATAAGLAVLLARNGRSVVLLDADLRRPGVAPALGLEGEVGLTAVLLGRCAVDDVLQTHSASGLPVLTSGELPADPTAVLGSTATRALLDRLRTEYDVVVIDSAPVLPVADAALVAGVADEALLTVRHGHTTHEQLEEATRRITRGGVRVAGVAATMVPEHADAVYC